MLAPANYYFLHQELCFFICLLPIKKLHCAPLSSKAVVASNICVIVEDGNNSQVIEFVSFLTFHVFLFQLKLSFTLDKETMMPQGCYIYQYRDSNK